jgi:hypothetical protein
LASWVRQLAGSRECPDPGGKSVPIAARSAASETWAHYLHVVDTLEMASNFGVQVRPIIDGSPELSANIDFDPYVVSDFGRIVQSWLPFVFAMNSVNRAIGTRDMYPFVLAPPVIEKLTFIHGLTQACRTAASNTPPVPPDGRLRHIDIFPGPARLSRRALPPHRFPKSDLSPIGCQGFRWNSPALSGVVLRQGKGGLQWT